MELSFNTLKIIEKDLESQLDQKIKDIPVRVFIAGIELDLDKEDRMGGEIHLFFDSQFYCVENGKEYKLVEI